MDKNSYHNLSGVLKIGGESREMIVTDASYGLTWQSFDVNNPINDYPDLNYKPLVSLIDNVYDGNTYNHLDYYIHIHISCTLTPYY